MTPPRSAYPVNFPFRFTPAFRAAELPFGVTPGNSMISVDETQLRVRFGPWQVSTPRSNIRAASITGPYLFIKTAGPARLTFSDRGLTFASNNRRGVLLEFHEPIPGIEPTGRLRHPNLTVTPADCDAFAALLAAP